MNGKTAKKIRKEVKAEVKGVQKEVVNTVFNHLNSLEFFERVKIAVRIIRKKL